MDVLRRLNLSAASSSKRRTGCSETIGPRKRTPASVPFTQSTLMGSRSPDRSSMVTRSRGWMSKAWSRLKPRGEYSMISMARRLQRVCMTARMRTVCRCPELTNRSLPSATAGHGNSARSYSWPPGAARPWDGFIYVKTGPGFALVSVSFGTAAWSVVDEAHQHGLYPWTLRDTLRCPFRFRLQRGPKRTPLELSFCAERTIALALVALDVRALHLRRLCCALASR